MIHRLELHNFKCFENAEIECSPLTMLCGVNSCGKSSVIQAVLLLEETRCSTGMIDLMNMQHGTVLYSFDEILYDDAGAFKKKQSQNKFENIKNHRKK